MTLSTAQIMRERVCMFFPVGQLSLLVMRGYNMCSWCYFSSHFTLRLKGSGAIVTVAKVAWHILKWPLALSLGVLALSFTSFSRSDSLCYSLHTVYFLNSSLCPPCSYLLLSFPVPCVPPPAYFLPTPLPHCSPLPLFILSSPLLRPVLPEDTHVLSGP